MMSSRLFVRQCTNCAFVVASSFLWNCNSAYTSVLSGVTSGVARAFPGERVAHPEGQNEEENK